MFVRPLSRRSGSIYLIYRLENSEDVVLLGQKLLQAIVQPLENTAMQLVRDINILLRSGYTQTMQQKKAGSPTTIVGQIGQISARGQQMGMVNPHGIGTKRPCARTTRSS